MTVIDQRNLPAADPGHHPANEAVALRHGEQQVEDAPRDQPEVTGVGRDLHVGQAADQAIEGRRGGALEQALPVALATLAVDHVCSLVDHLHHVDQQLGRILQVGVDDQDALAPANRQPGRQGELVPMVSHQPDGHDARVALGRFGHDIPCAIARAVVDQHHLARPADPVQDGADPAQKLGQGVLLVEAGRHDGNGRAWG